MTTSALGKVGLLLAGGGAKCLYQAAGVQAFFDHGLDYDILYGSSGGSLNGMMVHQGKHQLLKNLWTNIRTSDVYKWDIWKSLWPLGDRACLYDSSPLSQLITKNLDYQAIVSNQRQFKVAVTDYSLWQPLFFEIGKLPPEDVHTAIFASASPPVYFPCVDYHGHRLADAGLVSNFNIERAVDDGCDTLIILGFARPEPYVPKNIVEAWGETTSIALYGYYQKEVDIVEQMNRIITKQPVDGKRPIKLIQIIPDQKRCSINFLDFDYKGMDREEMWQYGYALARSVLAEELN